MRDGERVLWTDEYGIVRHGRASFSHPVGSPYQRAIDYGGYRPVKALPGEIRLANGRVSCISCHGSYQLNHGDTLLAGDFLGLCYGCHDL